MLIDSKIIARHGAREVLQQRFELAWPDGSLLQSHAVRAHGVIEPGLRALPMPAGGFLLVDLGRLVPQLGEDLARAHERDRPGLVFFSLRKHFRCADALIEAGAAIGELAGQEVPA